MKIGDIVSLRVKMLYKYPAYRHCSETDWKVIRVTGGLFEALPVDNKFSTICSSRIFTEKYYDIEIVNKEKYILPEELFTI